MSKPELPKTLVDPNEIETVDALGERRRAERDREIDPEARAQLLASLPASTSPTGITIGRYQLLGIVGTGGMGMVFGAWDPELERRIALKLVKLSSAASRDRMLREGQILARLSHPNVVPVFDVGQVGDQIYLVMEYVRGATLKAFAADKPDRRAILDAYRQAGAGLAAAHAAGVIHRDFKPTNAIRGDDGRVRVLDFGIAHTGGTTDRAGTPAYMAPEQRDPDGELTAAVDQYAFCVSLREALGDDVPAWIAGILDRGTREDPAARYPTFDALLSALAHDSAKRWRWAAVGGGIAIAAAAAFAIGHRSSNSVEPCVGGAAEIARAWNRDSRAHLVEHLKSLGPRGASEGDRLAKELDADARAWADEHRAACLANKHNDLSPARYDLRLGCLDRTRAHMSAVVELVSSTSAADLDNALFAARMRPDAHGCANVSDLIAPPPAGLAPRIAAVEPAIERALVLAAAWHAEAEPIATQAVADARAIGYAPLLAHALLTRGRALMAANKVEAADVLDEAMRIAMQASDDATAVEAYARWVFVRAAVAGAPTTENLSVVELLGKRLGARGRFARALLYNNVGVSRTLSDDLVGARKVLENAAKEAEGAPEIELAVIGQSLANLEPTIETSLARMEATYRRYLDALGPAHAQTIFMRMVVGEMTPDRKRAREMHECTKLEGQAHRDCLYEAAWLADEDGDIETATRSMADYTDFESSAGRVARAYVAMRKGGLSAEVRRDLDAIASGPAPLFYDRLYAADASIVIALGSTGPAADAAWLRANQLAAAVGIAVYRRRLARTDAEVAQRFTDDAVMHAERALAWYRASSDHALVAKLDAIKAAGSGSR